MKEQGGKGADVVCLLGSPRRGGNSDVLAGRFMDTAGSLGARTRTFVLNDLDYRGCQGCMACKTRLERCILEDDLGEVLEAVRACDVLVLATPVYFGEVTGQLKLAIDRFFSFLVPGYARSAHPSRLAPGKKLAFLIAQGHPKDKLFEDIFPRYKWFLRWMGFDETALVRALGVYDMGDVAGREDYLLQAEAAARQLLA
jgi:multimeric flavodoxin WrbA